MTIRILVPVKRVVDANVRVRVSSNGAIDTTGLKMSLNPFDECAVEKALRLREVGAASHVTIVTCGQTTSQDVLRAALAMGADNAVLIDTTKAMGNIGAAPDPLAIARLLHAFMINEAYDLVLCGKQAIDDDTGGVPAMLAALLGWPQALNASKLEPDLDGWKVTCGEDSGTAVWRLRGASVVSADLRLAEPRRVTLPNIVKAKQKPLHTLDAATFDVDLQPASRIVQLAEPPLRQGGVKVADIAALSSVLGTDRLFQSSGVAQ